MLRKMFVSACVAATTLLGLHAGAKAETLQFYSSITSGPQANLVEQIEKKFPGVKVEWVRGGGIALFQRFVSERMAGKGKIDLLHFSYTPGWYYLAGQGWLLKGAAAGPEAAKYPDWAKSPDGSFVALRVPTLQVVYNADKVKPEDVPTSWTEFLTSKWRGKIVLCNPFQSAGVWDFFYGSKDFGVDYIKKLLKNDVLIQPQMGAALDSVARGERDVSFIFEYIALDRMARAPNLKFAHMSEGVPVIPAPVGVVADSAHPDLAKKVLDFMLSADGQRVMTEDVKTYSARADVPPPAGLPPLSKTKLLFSDFQKVYREQDQYRDLMNRAMRGR